MNEDRLPPHSPDAERGVLGCMLLEPEENIGAAREALPPDDEAFYDLRHRLLYQQLQAMADARVAVDAITVRHWLGERGLVDRCGGLAYVSEHQDLVPNAQRLDGYAQIVRDKYLLRRMLRCMCDGARSIFDAEKPAHEILAGIEQAVLRAAEVRLGSREVPMKALIRAVSERYLETFVRGRKMMLGIPSGFNYFDNMVPGFGPGDYVVIAARPGMGKSALMMQIAEHIALDQKFPVHVFSMEMSAPALAVRQLFQRAGANLRRFTNGFLVEEEVTHLTEAAARLAVDNWTVDDTGRVMIEDVEVKARRLKRQYGVRAFFVDYLQLLGSRARRWNNRNDEMAEVSARLKALAKELEVPFILLAQLNREIEKEAMRRPRLADLRESGNIEQDADVVSFLYRPRVDPDKADDMTWLPKIRDVPEEWRHPMVWRKHMNRVNWYVAKHRNGPTGDCAMVFIRDWVRFVDAYTPRKQDADEPRHSQPEDE